MNKTVISKDAAAQIAFEAFDGETVTVDLLDMSATASFSLSFEDSIVLLTVRDQRLSKASSKSLRRLLKAIEETLP